MRAVSVGVQERNRNDVGIERTNAGHNLSDGGVGERKMEPLGDQSFARTHCVIARNERWRVVARQIVERGAILSREVEDIGEAVGGNERDAGAGALEEHVRGHGGAVNEA